MGSYHSKEFEDFKNEGVYEHIQKYPYMGATGVSIQNIPAPDKVKFLDLYTDKNWNYIEIRIYFEGDPNKYLESNGTVESPMAHFLKEQLTDEYDVIMNAYGSMHEDTGDGYVFINGKYLDGTIEEYVDHIAYPLAEKVVELFN